MFNKIFKSALQYVMKSFEDYAVWCVDAESLLPIQYYYEMSETSCGPM